MADVAEPRVITKVLQLRLRELRASGTVVELEDLPDVLFLVGETSDSSNIVHVLAHSTILKRECDYFREVLQSSSQERYCNEADYRGYSLKKDLPKSGFSDPCSSNFRSSEDKNNAGSQRNVPISSNADNSSNQPRLETNTSAGQCSKKQDAKSRTCSVTFAETISKIAEDRDRKTAPGGHNRNNEISYLPKEEDVENIDRSGRRSISIISASLDGGGSTLKNRARKATEIQKQLEQPKASGEELVESVRVLNARAPIRQRSQEHTKVNYVVIRRYSWIASNLYAILEWIYTHCCHIQIEELPSVYHIARQMIFTSLTSAIEEFCSVIYSRHAIESESKRKAILKLCVAADCQELRSVKCLCESLATFECKSEKSLCSFVLSSAFLPYRKNQFLNEGFCKVGGHSICVLKELESATKQKLGKNFDTAISYITLVRKSKMSEITNFCKASFHRLSKNRPKRPKMRHVVWRITVLENDIARSCYAFYKHASKESLETAEKAGHIYSHEKKEIFSLRIITGLMISTILQKALCKAVPQGLIVKEARGSGYYIKGPSYCTSVILYGDPLTILIAAKAIPMHMVGRTALRIRCPSETTFVKFLPAMVTFGVDLEADTIYLLKSLDSIVRILEFATGLSDTENCMPMSFEREMVELVEPTDPF
ncbi:hypothetical protein O6H91_17G034200 [Diphasiastrum complanatum]|uniref:Uncharacterized protein n=1 Tax=Diphasiastrum complanatum TaxID=34168 RepID=A0ACC2B5M0_DIPCM|nr:hypothetical protein O6H91_17G034200 [Diphasiastrum complanatum]